MDFDFDLLKELEKHFDEIYVRQQTCNEIQKMENDKIAKIDKCLEVAVHDFSLIKKIMWLLLSTAVGSLLTSLLQLVLK